MKLGIGNAGKIINQLVWVRVSQYRAYMSVFSNSWRSFDLVKQFKSGYLVTFKKNKTCSTTAALQLKP